MHGSGAGGTTVVEVWLAEHPFPAYDGRHFLDPLKAMAEEFGRRHPEFRIDVRGVDFRAMPAEVARAAAQGRPPDVAEYYATSTQTARDTRAAGGRPLFVPISRAIAGRAEILGEPVVTTGLEAAVRGHYTQDGELLGMPVTATTALLFTNTTLLAAAGIEEIPRTWEDVEAACKALAGTDRPPSHGITWPNHGWLFQQAVATQAGLLADHDNGRRGRATTVHLASDEMLAWVRWWAGLAAQGHHLYAPGWPEAIGAFARQDVAFVISSSKTARELAGIGAEAGFGVAASPMPRNGQAPYGGHLISGQALWLADGLPWERRDGALAFTQYLAEARNSAAWHKAVGFMPVTTAAFDLLDREGWFRAHPHQRAATDQLRASGDSPAALGALLGAFAGIQDVMTEAMRDVLENGREPGVRFARANGRAQRLLDDHATDCLGARTPRHLGVG